MKQLYLKLEFVRHTPVAKYLIKPEDKVRVFREEKSKWYGPFKVTKVIDKIIAFMDGVLEKPFNTTQILPIAPKKAINHILRMG